MLRRAPALSVTVVDGRWRVVVTGRRTVIYRWRCIVVTTTRRDCRADAEPDQAADDRGPGIVAVVVVMLVAVPVCRRAGGRNRETCHRDRRRQEACSNSHNRLLRKNLL